VTDGAAGGGNDSESSLSTWRRSSSRQLQQLYFAKIFGDYDDVTRHFTMFG
jgi:hypothetical protein